MLESGMADINYQGIALIITALGSAIAAILSAITLSRGNARDGKLQEIHELVNGQSHKINAMAEAKGFVEGGNEERARPTQPK